MKKTMILMWNPAISSYKMDAFEDDLDYLTDDWETDYNWSIHDSITLCHNKNGQ